MRLVPTDRAKHLTFLPSRPTDHRPCSATGSRSLSLALWPPASSSVALWRASVRCEEIVRSTVSRSFRPPPTTSPPPTSQTILHMSSGGRRGGRASSVSTATTAEKIRLGAPNGPSELVSFHIPGHPTSPYRYCVLHMVIWTRRRGLRKTRRRAATNDEPRSLISLSLFPSLSRSRTPHAVPAAALQEDSDRMLLALRKPVASPVQDNVVTVSFSSGPNLVSYDYAVACYAQDPAVPTTDCGAVAAEGTAPVVTPVTGTLPRGYAEVIVPVTLTGNEAVDCLVTVSGGPIDAVAKCQYAEAADAPTPTPPGPTPTPPGPTPTPPGPTPTPPGPPGCTSADNTSGWQLNANGVTVECTAATVGTTGNVCINGSLEVFTKRDRDGLLAIIGGLFWSELPTSCTTGVDNMSNLWVLTSPAVRSPAPTPSRSRSLRASLARSPGSSPPLPSIRTSAAGSWTT